MSTAAFVTNQKSGTVSTIDVKARTKNSTDTAVGEFPTGVAVTPDGKTAYVTNQNSGTVSTIDVKTRTKNHRHPRRRATVRGGGHAVSPVTGSPTQNVAPERPRGPRIQPAHNGTYVLVVLDTRNAGYGASNAVPDSVVMCD